MNRLLCPVGLALALAFPIEPANADPAPADPYAITPDVGPWVICAASYCNGDARYVADQMVEQLRTKHNLPAYVFDRGDAERQKDWEEHLKLERSLGEGVHLPFKHPRYTPSCAVLIGGYPDMESATAALAKVKQLPCPELKLSNGQPARDEEFVVKINKTSGTGDKISAIVNPYTRSFITRNPTAPAPRVEASKVDPIWKELNAPESYSLLKNPKPWTLMVKEYAGTTSVQNRSESTGILDKLSPIGRKPGDGINAAGLQAHQLAEFLRDKRIGLDAYVLHTRTSSIVTVGGFNGPDDPELQRTMRRLQSLSFKVDPRAAAANPAMIKNDPIGLSSRPLPMEVPRF
jgi:hypothetical protein